MFTIKTACYVLQTKYNCHIVRYLLDCFNNSQCTIVFVLKHKKILLLMLMLNRNFRIGNFNEIHTEDSLFL